MATRGYTIDGDVITISVAGRVDSTNAPALELEIQGALASKRYAEAVLDCDELEYISSAGLRVVLRLAKSVGRLHIVNASSAVYEVFEMTGFTEMFDVSKAYRRISVEGCEVIGQGANGKVYRIDPETIVKVYLNPDSLPEIRRERELARTAFVHGVPTAIPYDVVRVGEGYGSVFELLNAKSYAKLLIAGEKTVDEISRMSVDLLKIIHGTLVDANSMPSMRDVALGWAQYLVDYLPAEQGQKLVSLVEAVPEDLHMMHGDYHIKNVMVQNGESLLIDMDTLCHGHPVFELASMYNAYVGFGLTDHSIIENFMGIPFETSEALWNTMLRLYLDDADEATVRSVEEKAIVVGLMRMMRRTIRRGGMEDEQGRAQIKACESRLCELLGRVDTLVF